MRRASSVSTVHVRISTSCRVLCTRNKTSFLGRIFDDSHLRALIKNNFEIIVSLAPIAVSLTPKRERLGGGREVRAPLQGLCQGVAERPCGQVMCIFDICAPEMTL